MDHINQSKENSNWLQQVKLGNSDFDNVNTLSFRGDSCTLYSLRDKVVGILGDKTMADVARPYFEVPLTTTVGEMEVLKGRMVSTSRIVTLKPGDKSYIGSILIEKIQNELGWAVNSGN